MSDKIVVSTDTLAPLAEATRVATGTSEALSANEAINLATNIVESGGSSLPGGGTAHTYLVRNSSNQLEWAERTHWAEQVAAEILPPTTPTPMDDTSFMIAEAFPVQPVAGGTYTVNWNGVEYECIAQDYDTGEGAICVLIGNAAANGGDDTGEPFAMIVVPAEYVEALGIAAQVIALDGSTSVTIAINGVYDEVHKIDAKYLPESEINNSNIVNGVLPGTLRSITSMTEDSEYYLGYGAVAFGKDTQASGEMAFAAGYQTIASGSYSHAEGCDIVASGGSSHAEGYGTEASGEISHAEGHHTIASNESSHAEGSGTTASGSFSHAEGYYTTASGSCSHAEGRYTVANGNAQHTQGKFNIEDGESRYAHIVGNGASKSRSNAYTLDWDGNAWFSGDVYVGSTSGTNKDEGSKKLATEEYVNSILADDQILLGTTQEVTPQDVLGALQTGKNILLMYQAADYSQPLAFTSFFPYLTGSNTYVIGSHNVSLVETGIFQLVGDVNNNTWNYSTTEFATQTDIPTTLPNPNALTFEGAVTGTYDGSSAMTIAIPTVAGEDGVGIESITQTTTSTVDDGNNIITVTLTNGTTSTFTVQNGSKGSDGYSPVRGTDYWTDADKAEIKAYVDEAILGGEW